jgi:hypothetical protein
MLAPYPSEEMTYWPVSARVGNVKNNEPSLIGPISAQLTCVDVCRTVCEIDAWRVRPHLDGVFPAAANFASRAAFRVAACAGLT